MSQIDARLHHLPQAELEALAQAADALTSTGLKVVRWLSDAASIELDLRRGQLGVIPSLPHEDRAVGALAVAAIVEQFQGREEFAATVAFLKAVLAELIRRF